MYKKISSISMLLAAAVLITSTAYGQFFYMENENIGQQANNFTLKRVNKEPISLEKYRDGNNAIVFFWATWCPHCRVQLGELNANKEKLEKEKLKIVLVDVGESEAIVNKFIEKTGVQFDVFLDIESEISDLYGIVGVPTFYFIDEKGVVVDVQHSLPDDLNEMFLES